MDDFTFAGDTWKECLDIFFEIMDKSAKYNVKLNYDKIFLIQDKIKALGRIVDGKYIRLDEETREKIVNSALPTSVKQLQSFLGMGNWCREFMTDLNSVPVTFPSYVSKILTPMITEEGSKLNWSPERIEAFNQYKQLAVNHLALHFFNPEEKVHLATDASKHGWGAILFHLNEDGSKRIFAISSGTFTASEMKWSINEQEAFAIVKAFKAFRPYLSGRVFNLFTDHKNLTFIHAASSPKIVRWAADINQFTFVAYHIPGPLNWETDFLSRIISESIVETAIDANT